MFFTSLAFSGVETFEMINTYIAVAIDFHGFFIENGPFRGFYGNTHAFAESPIRYAEHLLGTTIKRIHKISYHNIIF